jgi:hypothetical protein
MVHQLKEVLPVLVQKMIELVFVQVLSNSPFQTEYQVIRILPPCSIYEVEYRKICNAPFLMQIAYLDVVIPDEGSPVLSQGY